MKKQLHIIADANIWGAKSALATLTGFQVHLTILEHHEITAAAVQHADILLVRSSTKVNQTLLANSAVRFVGTATIGDDHIDHDYLKSSGIASVSAAGSSTESVVEYMLSSFYRLEQLGKLSLKHDTLGIIGLGRIGSLLQQACHHTLLKTLANDPPRQVEEEGLNLKSMDYLLEHADILTLHMPLVKSGAFKTTHLLGAKALHQFKGRGIINAARGDCLDNGALLSWLNANPERFAVLDCWENEPHISLALLEHPQVLLATPHIAGHSLDGKAANTFFVYRDLCKHLNIETTWDVAAQLPSIEIDHIPTHMSPAALSQCLYPIAHDHHAMKHAAAEPSRFASWFQNYRRHYPVRRSWLKSLTAHPHYKPDIFL